MANQSGDQGRTISTQIEELGRKLRKKRITDGLSLSQVAKACGVSAATLSRLERQRAGSTSFEQDDRRTIPDVRTINAVRTWLGDAAEASRIGGPKATESSDVSIALPVPEAVEVHLRADRNLRPEQAELLARTFNGLYQAFRGSGLGHEPSSIVDTSEEHGE